MAMSTCEDKQPNDFRVFVSFVHYNRTTDAMIAWLSFSPLMCAVEDDDDTILIIESMFLPLPAIILSNSDFGLGQRSGREVL